MRGKLSKQASVYKQLLPTHAPRIHRACRACLLLPPTLSLSCRPCPTSAPRNQVCRPACLFPILFSPCRLCPTYASDINSPLRHVRTRIYFTSESHIHSLVNVLRFCHLRWARRTYGGGRKDCTEGNM